ncbi:MAG: hypothetical protein ACK6DY_13345, partial [Acidobacteriota bacterium]
FRTRYRLAGLRFARHPPLSENGLDKRSPDHSTLSRTRRLIDVETLEQVFGFALHVIAARGLLKGKTIGVDATTLEANAAMRSIVRRDTGDNYQEFLTELAPKF